MFHPTANLLLQLQLVKKHQKMVSLSIDFHKEATVHYPVETAVFVHLVVASTLLSPRALSQNTTTDQCMETGSAEAAQFPVITLPQDVYSDTADVLQELANEYNNKPFSLEHKTTVAPHSTDTTVVPHSTDTTVVPHPSETTVVPHSTNTTVVPHSTETTDSTETTSVSTQVSILEGATLLFPLSEDATAIPLPSKEYQDGTGTDKATSKLEAEATDPAVTAKSKAESAYQPASCKDGSSGPSKSRVLPTDPLHPDYLFVKEPSQDFYCPVTYCLMLRPHLTSCCRQNLSKEAATRIQGEGKACPLCRASKWSTKINKEMRKKVKSLKILCPNVDRGCQWQGKLYDFDSHVKSCPMNDSPLVTRPTGSVTERTKLHDAAERRDVEMVKRLVSTMAVDINSRTALTGETALIIASFKGDVKIVCLLLEAGEDLNITDKNGRTPLFWASSRGHIAVVKILLENGADTSICRKGGASPVYVASLNGHPDVVDLLVQAGADIHLTETEHGDAPLGAAAANGHTETVKTLLKAGATVNYKEKNGMTPVYLASEKGHTDVVDVLVQAGADIHLDTKVLHYNTHSVLFSRSSSGGYCKIFARLSACSSVENVYQKQNSC
ncbi:Ankyrin repeat domain-containing protein 29 [Geodia barretti]|uniref:Ankyrin repeat domain-containing protein 29 n=1 Tax=Geodia barretti TaxID=519541 RepID=A0AA35TL91_GEOBA|nr:Ankyrin repeat domain-containing protein 29 [Geodia barretti]